MKGLIWGTGRHVGRTKATGSSTKKERENTPFQGWEKGKEGRRRMGREGRRVSRRSREMDGERWREMEKGRGGEGAATEKIESSVGWKVGGASMREARAVVRIQDGKEVDEW